MKFENVEQLKQFLIWAKSQQIQEVTVNGVTARFSQFAFVPGLTPNSEPDPDVPTYEANSKTWDQTESNPDDDEELLFWSANGN